MIRIHLAGAVVALIAGAGQAAAQPKWTAEEKPIVEQLHRMRSVPDEQRGAATRKVARQIRGLAAGESKVSLAEGLANLSTEGDFGADTLREVAATLAAALSEHPRKDVDGAPAGAYVTLAQLAHYEQVPVAIDAAAYRAALAKLEAEDRLRASADVHLTDTHGKEWVLSDLRGKVVLVNFWATWCPPCRKEFPDLEGLYRQFADKGFVILAISDEEASKITPFVTAQKVTFPVLIDQGGKVSKSYDVEGIPKSFVYDREGKLVATAIDMRTRNQFFAMLAKAGLR